MTREPSDELIDALQRAAAFPHPVAKVELLQTHISWVILTGEFAYKIKKPVDLGFVDFSTLQRRHFFCDEELRLNRRLAPDLYLDVLPIVGPATAPRIAGSGTPIEYCVRMRQFPQECLLSRLVANGRLLPRHIDALARQVWEFHARIPRAVASSRFGSPEAVAEPIRANFSHLKAIEADEQSGVVQRLRNWCEQELRALHDTLASRKQRGFIRECHGDLHLGNMILRDDTITLFDCIEFNEDLRWIDVASEIAFCTMDLEDRGRPDLARRFLNTYLEWSGDYEGLAVFPLYFTYRALVRAKVAQLRREQADLLASEDERLRRELGNYLDLAERSMQRKMPFLAITHGLSGSGKTWGSQAVIERFGAIRIRSDLERKRLGGFSPLADTGSGIATGLYSAEFNRRTFQKLRELADSVLGSGFPVIIDATFLKQSDREPFRELAESLGMPFLILDFPADEGVCRERIRRRAREGTDASEATEEVLDRQLRAREPFLPDETRIVVPFSTESPETIASSLDEIERRRARFRPSANL